VPATPNFLAIRVTRGVPFRGFCYGQSGCSAPYTDLTGLPANGAFYFQAFSGSVALPAAGYNYSIGLDSYKETKTAAAVAPG
jgi:hypothetical protein